MNIKKLYTHTSPRQIWRILISGSDKIIIETRDVNTKEVFFSCYELNSGKTVFKDFQLEEKYWAGIETVYEDIILFHKFPKPDLPGHKDVIALDILTQKIKWEIEDYSFLFVYEDKVYCYRQNFESRSFFAFNIYSGSLIRNLGEDFKEVNKLRQLAEGENSFKDYLYPEVYIPEASDEKIIKAIDSQISTLQVEGEVESTVYNNFLFFSFHSKTYQNILTNNFCAINIDTNTVLFSEVLNENVSALLTDSFFVYKNFLFVLKEKNGLTIYKME